MAKNKRRIPPPLPHEMRPLDRYHTAREAIKKGRLNAAQAAWAEFCYEVLGEYPPRDGSRIPKTEEHVGDVAARLKRTRSEAKRMIEHVEAMRPPKGKPPRRTTNPKFAWHLRDDARRIRVVRQLHPLRIYRLSHGMSANAMADRSGFSNETIDNWENNRSAPTLRSIHRMCKLMNVDPETLCAEWLHWMDLAEGYVKGDTLAMHRYLQHLSVSGGIR